MKTRTMLAAGLLGRLITDRHGFKSRCRYNAIYSNLMRSKIDVENAID